MTEYIDIKPEPTEDANVARLVTNLDLTGGGPPEDYLSPEEGDDGSPLAQSIFAVPGLAELHMRGGELLVRRMPDVEWQDVIEDITDVLRDFFL